eukprot:64016-Lingulodinium_polyedra.AAC.1
MDWFWAGPVPSTVVQANPMTNWIGRGQDVTNIGPTVAVLSTPVQSKPVFFWFRVGAGLDQSKSVLPKSRTGLLNVHHLHVGVLVGSACAPCRKIFAWICA